MKRVLASLLALALSIAPLHAQDLINSQRILSKIVTSTRDLTLASGSVGYTGFGFKPTTCHAHGSITNATSYTALNGFVDSALSSHSLFMSNGNFFNTTNFMSFVDSTGANAQAAVVASFDADGLTLTWTKTASPTGTASFWIVCYR